MSTKSTIILSKDNEYWFRDCGYETNTKGEHVTDFIDMEFNNENAKIVWNDDEGFKIRLYPGSDLYKQVIEKMKVFG